VDLVNHLLLHLLYHLHDVAARVSDELAFVLRGDHEEGFENLRAEGQLVLEHPLEGDLLADDVEHYLEGQVVLAEVPLLLGEEGGSEQLEEGQILLIVGQCHLQHRNQQWVCRGFPVPLLEEFADGDDLQFERKHVDVGPPFRVAHVALFNAV